MNELLKLWKSSMKRVLSKCWSSSKRVTCHMFKSVKSPEKVTVWGVRTVSVQLITCFYCRTKVPFCVVWWRHTDSERNRGRKCQTPPKDQMKLKSRHFWTERSTRLMLQQASGSMGVPHLIPCTREPNHLLGQRYDKDSCYCFYWFMCM